MVEPQTVLNVLLKHEQASDLVDKKLIHQAISESVGDGVLNLVIFSCLVSERGKEELITDFFKTLFFDGGGKEISSNARRAMKITSEIETLGLKINVIPILVDTEPRRTWGWQVPQDELTLSCEIMLEQAKDSKLLPENWKPVLWSELESRYQGPGTFEKSLEWTKTSGRHSLCVAQQAKHLAGFSDRYTFPLGLEETALRQVGAYAYEGQVLEQIFPNAILLQSEYPWKEKDVLYQWLRSKKKPLQIIHPFPS